jgi:DNA-binding PadR family transcriptional regulator
VLSRDRFRLNPGSLFPSLYRLEQDGKLKADWRSTENNRRAKYYRLTTSGRRQLERQRERWNQASFAVMNVLEGA